MSSFSTCSANAPAAGARANAATKIIDLPSRKASRNASRGPNGWRERPSLPCTPVERMFATIDALRCDLTAAHLHAGDSVPAEGNQRIADLAIYTASGTRADRVFFPLGILFNQYI